MSFLVSKKDFAKTFDRLKEKYELFGPTIKKGQGIYSDTDTCTYDRLASLEALELATRTYFSAKETVFPISEKLFEFTPDGPCEPKVASRKKIVFARSCDIEGFARLDRIFFENGPETDYYYNRLRDDVSFFLIECVEGFDGCFCRSLGTDDSQGHAVSLRDAGDGFIVAIREQCFKEFFENPDREEERCKSFGERNSFPQETVPIPKLNNKDLFKDAPWDEYSKRCIGCGRCTIVCPTCSCFSIADIQDEKGGQQRKRVWASCHMDGFAKVAGGHEYRVDKGRRMRYKIFHKFHDFKLRFGEQMCVGCGRCVAACPEYIDIRTTLRKLCNGQSL